MPGTMAKTEIIYPKNVRAKVIMDFTQNEYIDENPGSRFGATS